MTNILVLNNICGDEDPEYLFVEYFKSALQETIYKKIIQVQNSKLQQEYINVVCEIINEAWNEMNN